MRFNVIGLLTGTLVMPIGVSAQESNAEAFVGRAVEGAAASIDARLALAMHDQVLARSRALRLPTLTLTATHAEVSGGADVGALINPAFAAINALTGQDALPTDVSFTFPLRQDARARVAVPLFDPAIGAAVDRAQAERDLGASALGRVRRDLEAALRVGLLRHSAAAEAVRVRRAVLAALEEELRVAERRADEGLATADVVLRSRADRSEAVQRVLEAEQQQAVARRAVNRLARRDLTATLPIVSDSTFRLALPTSLEEALHRAMQREELVGADAGIAAARAGQRAAGALSLPTVTLAADAGWQGDRWRFTGENDVQQLTVVASWTPFHSGRDARQRAEARLQTERAAVARDAIHDLIALEVHDAWDALHVTRAALTAAIARDLAAERAWALVQRSHSEGIASHLELTSARAVATSAEVGLVLARYAVAEAAVRLAQVTGSTAAPLPEIP